MTYEWARLNILSEIPGYDPSYEIEYFNSWSTYEENGYGFILSKNSKFYLLEYQYSVMVENNSESWDLIEQTEDEALTFIIDYDKICDEINEGMQ